MATTAAEAASKAVVPLARNFPVGRAQIFLPNHIITFVRPRQKQQPNLATFIVPLQFNKLDFRDYLFHAYNVRVNAVRSFLRAQAPDQKRGAPRGRMYRPRPDKYMIVELESPFVWPDPPAEDDREDFDYTMWKTLNDQDEVEIELNRKFRSRVIPLRTEKEESNERKMLADMADDYLSGKEVWKNNLPLDETWDPIVQKMQAKKLHDQLAGLHVGKNMGDGRPRTVKAVPDYDEQPAKSRGPGAKKP